MWWPGGDPSCSHRLSQAERDLAHHQQYPKGLMLYTPIKGYTGSSTRTELAAAIIALVANGPVHIGIDSCGLDPGSPQEGQSTQDQLAYHT